MAYDAQGRYSRTGGFSSTGKKLTRKTRAAARAVTAKRANTGGISSTQIGNRFRSIGKSIAKSLKTAKTKGNRGRGSSG